MTESSKKTDEMSWLYTSVSPVANCTEVLSDLIDEGNVTEAMGEYIPYSQRPETYFVPIIFSLIIIIGITGNSVLAFTIFKHRNMRTQPNIHVLSLAIGDILVLITTVPFTMSIYLVESWPFGPLICKVSEIGKDVSAAVTVFTLTALSADKYFAIVDPMKKLYVTGGKQATHCTIAVVVLIWTLAAICAIPASFAYIRGGSNANGNFSVCYPFPEEFGPTYPKVIVMSRFFINYVIPLCVIGVFYVLTARQLVRSTKNIPGEMQGQAKQVQTRKKVAKMVIIFVIVFAICFLPLNIYMLWFHYNPTMEKDYNAFWHYFRILGFSFAYINSCVNPIALYCVSGTFRQYFQRYLFWCIRKKVQKRVSRASSDISSRGRLQSFSMISLKKLSDNRHEQQELIRPSVMARSIRSPIKDQDTTITLSDFSNSEPKIQLNSSIEETACDSLITS